MPIFSTNAGTSPIAAAGTRRRPAHLTLRILLDCTCRGGNRMYGAWAGRAIGRSPRTREELSCMPSSRCQTRRSGVSRNRQAVPKRSRRLCAAGRESPAGRGWRVGGDPMPANPHASRVDIERLVAWILSLPDSTRPRRNPHRHRACHGRGRSTGPALLARSCKPNSRVAGAHRREPLCWSRSGMPPR